jgi:uncharacterized protein (DUF488 family)
MEQPIVYTVGHSTHPIDDFTELLDTYGITCLIDVRSLPASAHSPQYNQEPLSNYLKRWGIRYLHFGEEFGARQTESGLLDEDGKVDFEKVRKSYTFERGLMQLWDLIRKGEIIALMCSESEPFDCHRFSMISVALEEDGITVQHILRDKSLKSNKELEARLLKRYEKLIPHPDMFNPGITVQDQLKAAYRLRNKDIAFSPYKHQTREEPL